MDLGCQQEGGCVNYWGGRSRQAGERCRPQRLRASPLSWTKLQRLIPKRNTETVSASKGKRKSAGGSSESNAERRVLEKRTEGAVSGGSYSGFSQDGVF